MEHRTGSLPAVAELDLWRRNSYHPAVLCSPQSTAGRKEWLVTAGHVLTLILPLSRLTGESHLAFSVADPSLKTGT